jgi:beta-lactam-binding protein with PASTA domain
MATVPNVRGDLVNTASAKITAAGLKMHANGPARSANHEYAVNSQTPAPGAKVANGSTVDISYAQKGATTSPTTGTSGASTGGTSGSSTTTSSSSPAAASGAGGTAGTGTLGTTAQAYSPTTGASTSATTAAPASASGDQNADQADQTLASFFGSGTGYAPQYDYTGVNSQETSGTPTTTNASGS